MRHQPVPVSMNPDEIVTRPYVTLQPLSMPFGEEVLKPGSLVYARRSPLLSSARSYWIENYWGQILAIVTEERLRKDFERCLR